MKTYLAEIAGKDSIAAVHKFMREETVDLIIPTIVYTGTEYGDYSSYFKSIKYLSCYGHEHNVIIDDPIQLHDEQLWNILCVRYQNQLYHKYGFYTPCIMCHLFTHLLRIPILLHCNGIGIITGERFSHKGNLKANQLSITIECFNALFNKYNISLIQPLINIIDTNIIDKEIEDYEHFSSINDVKCILSGNLYGFSFLEETALMNLKKYLYEYIFPVGQYILECYFDNCTIQYDVLEKIIEGGLN